MVTVDWKGNHKSTFVTLGASSHSGTDREEHDYYATDPSAVAPLLRLVDWTDKPIWEAACGEGHLSKEMERLGCTVISTDLIDRGYGEGGVDFFKATELRAPYIITYPQYKYETEFLDHVIELGAERQA